MAEAADLGVLLVRRHMRSIVRTWGPLYLVFALLALATAEFGSWIPGAVIFCAKPWLDRSLMFVLSRAIFGEDTRWADLWAQRSAVWWGDLLSTLTVARLSPWRSYTQAIGQLEGQRGRARHTRRNQMLRGKRGAAGGMQFVFSNAEMVLCFGLFALALWFAPESARGSLWDWMFQGDSLANALASNALYALVVLVLEPFYVAAGFAMYLNRRVELEAWDVEQEFRRAFA
jgi:hypothetical protein